MSTFSPAISLLTLAGALAGSDSSSTAFHSISRPPSLPPCSEAASFIPSVMLWPSAAYVPEYGRRRPIFSFAPPAADRRRGSKVEEAAAPRNARRESVMRPPGAVLRQKSAFAVNGRSVGFPADHVAGRLVVADPEVPVGRLRAERRVGVAEPMRASGADGVAPDDLRVVAAVLSRSAGVVRVVVVAHLARPGAHHVGNSPPPRRSAGGDVLAAGPPAGVVLIVAVVGPPLRDLGGARGPGERRQRRRRLRMGTHLVVQVEPGLRRRGRSSSRRAAVSAPRRVVETGSTSGGEHEGGEHGGQAHGSGESSHCATAWPMFSRRLTHVVTRKDLALLIAPTYAASAEVDFEEAHERMERAAGSQLVVDRLYEGLSAALYERKGPRTSEDELIDELSAGVQKRRSRVKAAALTPGISAVIVMLYLDLGYAPEMMRNALENPKGKALLGDGLRALGAHLLKELIK